MYFHNFKLKIRTDLDFKNTVLDNGDECATLVVELLVIQILYLNISNSNTIFFLLPQSTPYNEFCVKILNISI